MSTQKVRITNQNSSFFDIVLILCLYLWFVQGCTKGCPGSENIIECAGQLTKQSKAEFDKGYNVQVKP